MARISLNETLKISFAALLANKLRTFLTLLGIIIAVITIVVIVGVIQGLNAYVAEKIIPMGAYDFAVERFPAIVASYEEFLKFSRRRPITFLHYQKVKELCRNCELVGAETSTVGTVKYRDRVAEDVTIRGETENSRYIGGVRGLYDGRPFTEEDIKGGRLVATIGWDVKEALFPHEDPVGKYIKIKGIPFLVIGVEEKKGKVLGISRDNFVAIPITTFFSRISQNRRRSISINIHTSSQKKMEAAMDEVRMIMRSLRHLGPKQEDDFSFITSESIINIYRNLTSTLYLAMIIISSISLVVGGIVVMNIMLVAVTERIPEIGLRRAVGARRSDILYQFLLESVSLAGFGGLIGVLLGSFGIFLVDKFSPLPARVEPWSITAALLVAGITGLVFGIYPAYRAATLDPVEALRREM